MKILVFRLTEAAQTWYVWACPSSQLHSFGSRREAQRFADQLAEAHAEAAPVEMEQSIVQAAALI
jgi:hypothetical protein